MESKEIINALNDVNDKYIEEAANYKAASAEEKNSTVKFSKTMKIWRGVAIAACVCLAGSLAFTAINLSSRSGSYSSKSDDILYSREADYSNALYEDVMEEAMEYDMEEMYFASESAMDNGMAPKVLSESAMAEAPEVWDSAATGDTESVVDSSKIIYNVWMTMQTKEFDEAAAGIEAVTAACGGYFENQYVSNNSNGYRNASYTIRVPAENLETLLNQVGDICTVTYISRSAEDVSDVYYDTDARLTTAKTKLERLQDLLANAKSMKDIITLEDAISETEWDIDYYSGSLRQYDSKIKYSTVNIELNEVYEIVKEEAPMSFGEKISQSFEQGLKGFGNFLQDLALWFAECWIGVLVVAVIVAVVVIVIVKIVRKKRR